MFMQRTMIVAIPVVRGVSTGYTPGVPQMSPTLKFCWYPAWGSSSSKDEGGHPLVLLGGTASVIESWVPHVKSLSRLREVILVEALGQGTSTAEDCRMESQVRVASVASQNKIMLLRLFAHRHVGYLPQHLPQNGSWPHLC